MQGNNMFELSIMLFIVFFLALNIVAIPFAKEGKLFSTQFFGVAIVMALFSIGLYFFTTDITSLQNWLKPNTHIRDQS